MVKDTVHYYKDILLADRDKGVIDNAVFQRLSAGYHFEPHMHPTVEVIVCLKGKSELTICQSTVELEKGNYVVVFQKHAHGFDVLGDEDCLILQIHFYPDVFTELFSDTLRDKELFFLLDVALERKTYITGVCSEQLYHGVYYVCEEARNKKKNHHKLMDLYFAQIVLLLSRDMAETRSDKVLKNRHLLSAFEYIKVHYKEKITVEEMANYCGISARRLGELFKNHWGMSISTYILYFRINKAIELMTEGKRTYTLTELALEVGFGSLQHFSKAFKTTMNISPAKYFSHLAKGE